MQVVNIDPKPYDTINVTPMLDLACVPVVFILMTAASVRGLTIGMKRAAARVE